MYEIGRYVRANDFGTAILLEAIVKRRPQIKKLVVASSMSIYGEGAYSCDSCGPVQPKLRPLSQLLDRDWELDCPQCGAKVKPVPTNEDKPLFPTSVYAISKQDQEQFCLVVGRAYDIPAVALRYFNVYGPRQALSNPYTGVCAIFSGRLLNDQPPLIFEDGEQTRDFVHVSDIVQANLLALETDKADYQALNIGTGFQSLISLRCSRTVCRKTFSRKLQANTGRAISGTALRIYREPGSCLDMSQECNWRTVFLNSSIGCGNNKLRTRHRPLSNLNSTSWCGNTDNTDF
jgi:nucleoside-diphosphate-sugar epimerase